MDKSRQLPGQSLYSVSNLTNLIHIQDNSSQSFRFVKFLRFIQKRKCLFFLLFMPRNKPYHEFNGLLLFGLPGPFISLVLERWQALPRERKSSGLNHLIRMPAIIYQKLGVFVVGNSQIHYWQWTICRLLLRLVLLGDQFSKSPLTRSQFFSVDLLCAYIYTRLHFLLPRGMYMPVVVLVRIIFVLVEDHHPSRSLY